MGVCAVHPPGFARSAGDPPAPVYRPFKAAALCPLRSGRAPGVPDRPKGV